MEEIFNSPLLAWSFRWVRVALAVWFAVYMLKLINKDKKIKEDGEQFPIDIAKRVYRLGHISKTEFNTLKKIIEDSEKNEEITKEDKKDKEEQN